VTLSEKAETAATSDHSRDEGIYPDDMPDTSLASAIRSLEGAEPTGNAWRVPDKVAKRIDVKAVQEEAPDGVTLHQTRDGALFVETDRFQSVISPDKLEQWIQGTYRNEEEQFLDALWHNPTSDYAVVSPLDFYEPLEEAIRDEDLGDHVFGTLKKYKGGGEVHIEMLFDKFRIDNPGEQDDEQVAADGGSSNPILLGVRTGYDYFGGTALYAEGFGQDTWCSNSIRNITDQKTRRHVGDPSETREWWDDILCEMDLMTDQLAELIEAAGEIEVDYLDFNFSEVLDHADDLQAYFEMVGFPTYLAREAASHVRSRAENQFLPTCWEVHSGATYAITHHYRGGENTSRLNELVQTANDFVMNPTQALETIDANAQQRAERQRRAATGEDGEGGEGELDEFSFEAKVEKAKRDLSDQRDEFESRRDELQTMLAGTAETEESE